MGDIANYLISIRAEFIYRSTNRIEILNPDSITEEQKNNIKALCVTAGVPYVSLITIN